MESLIALQQIDNGERLTDETPLQSLGRLQAQNQTVLQKDQPNVVLLPSEKKMF